MPHLEPIVLLSLLLLASLIQATSPPPQPFHVAVVHRHGARSTVVSVNQSGVCPSGCGVLNLDGKDMLYHLGWFLKTEYDSLFGQFTATGYDPVRFFSRSTDVARTIQSGSAMIRGLFSALEGTPQRAYPVIHNRPVDEDETLLVWDGNPSVVLWMDVVQNRLLALLNNITLQLFPNATILEAIGREIGLLDECTPSDPSKWSPFNCALDCQDAVNCALSAGFAVERFPTGVAQFDQLTKVLEAFNAYTMWGIDDLDNGGAYQAATGTLGYALAQDIVLTAASAAVPPSQGVPSTLLNHYSGHDTTLMPLWMTLGNDSLTNPLFGAAMVFEFYFANGSSSSAMNGNEAAWVRARIGAPGQLPDNHNYTFDWYTLYCVHPTDGSTYRAEGDVGCPLKDWSAFIAQQGPKVADPSCYYESGWMPSVNCTPSDSVAGGGNAVRVCAAFRAACLNACGDGYAMTPELGCVLSA